MTVAYRDAPATTYRPSAEHMVDLHGRICIPQTMWQACGNSPVLCRTIGHALLLLPGEKWGVLAFSGPPAWRMLAGSGAMPVSYLAPTDGSGTRRMTIPKPMREWARLEPGVEAVLEVLDTGGVLICEGKHFQAALGVANERLLELLERAGR